MTSAFQTCSFRTCHGNGTICSLTSGWRVSPTGWPNVCKLTREALAECNDTIKTNQLVLTSDTNILNETTQITQEQIASKVQSYKLEHTNGLGLVFIVDKMGCQTVQAHYDYAARNQMVPAVARHFGAAYVVYFDIATREVLSTKREVSSVGTGGSFRNFWFGPIKTIDSGLEKYH